MACGPEGADGGALFIWAVLVAFECPEAALEEADFGEDAATGFRWERSDLSRDCSDR